MKMVADVKTARNGKQASRDASPAKARDTDIVCACIHMSYGDLREVVTDGVGSFEDLLDRTKAGQRCTACLLDLEYHFSRLQATGAAGQGPSSGQPRNVDEDPGLRRRLWGLIDRVTPLVPLSLWNSAVVVAGPGIRQSVVVANDSMLYAGETAAPPMTVELRVRNAEGREVHRSRQDIVPGAALCHDVSQYLPPPTEGGLAVGSVEILRRARRPGYRGTTRPQILIDAPRGSCAVHTQAYYGPGEKWFAYYHQPAAHRFFAGLVNCTDRPMDFEISYPLDPVDTPDITPETRRLILPPRGAAIVETTLADAIGDQLADRLVRIRCRSTAPGQRKISFLCASPGLDRFSLDHPAG